MSKLNANSVELGSLTTAQRDALTSVSSGTLIYNTTSGAVEAYNGTSWNSLSNLFTATGGTKTTSSGTVTHTFTSPGDFIVSAGTAEVEVQVLGAGGGGSSGNGQWAVGGGGGGYAYASKSIGPGTYPVVRGTGGARQGNCGSSGNAGGNSTALGFTGNGGGGSYYPNVGSGGGYSIPGGTNLGSSPGGNGNGSTGDGSGSGGNNGRRVADGTFTSWGGGASGVPNGSPGPDASGYGNGGAGGHSCQNGHPGGGAGSPGIVVISYSI